MKISSWAATALATPAIATGVCLWAAATAQAAPDGADSSTSAGPTRSSGDSESESSAPARARASAKSPGAEKDSKRAERDVTDDDEPETPEKRNSGDEAEVESVPVSTRAAVAGDDDADGDEDADDDEGDGPEADTVELALDQITDAREDLKEATWDSGNVLAGLASVLPQMSLAGAYANLERWQLNHAALQQQYAATDEGTFAHWVAGLQIEASIQRTVHVQDQLEAAANLLEVVALFTPREEMAAVAELIDQAADNGLVYQILDVVLQEENGVPRVSPIFAMSVNGGEPVNVLLDTGSMGLVINPQVVGLEDMGEPIGHGSSCYGGCLTMYEYDIYNIPITVDEGVTSDRAPVLVVTLDTWYDLSLGNNNYEGILGIGPNAYGPEETTPLTALPGRLGEGILMDYRNNRAILGPNPYAARVTLPGAPINDLLVQVGDNEGQVIETNFDTGGLLGAIPSSLVGGAQSVPDGTLISVYTKDGKTLLFSYRTSGNNKPEVGDDLDFVLMGAPPFSQIPIYTSFVTGEMVLNYT